MRNQKALIYKFTSYPAAEYQNTVNLALQTYEKNQ